MHVINLMNIGYFLMPAAITMTLKLKKAFRIPPSIDNLMQNDFVVVCTETHKYHKRLIYAQH
jgi:hypothetical protein